ncbi:MAG: MFS transporter [Candidatus Thorarchaeota archaeon]
MTRLSDVDRIRSLDLEPPLSEHSLPLPSSNGRFSVISLVEIGRVLGDGINRTYALIYAVFIQTSPFLISIMISLRNLLQLATQSIFGRWSDKSGRKIFLLVGLLVSAFISFIFPDITDPFVFLLAMIIYSTAFGIFAPAWIAYLGDISTSENRGSFLGKISTIGVLCAFLALIVMGWGVGLLNVDYAAQYAIIFRIASIAFLLAGISSLFLGRSADMNRKTGIVSSKSSYLDQIKRLLSPLKENRDFRRFIIICAFMDFSMSLGWPIFGFIRERYASPSENSLMWATFMGFQIISLMIGGSAIDRYGKRIGFWGRRLMFLIPLVLFFATNWYEMALANLAGGFGFGLYYIAMNAHIIDSAPEESKGQYIGVFSLIMGLSTFVGSLLMGITTELLVTIIGKWETIYAMLIVVMIFRFIGGLNFYFIKYPHSRNA